MAMQDFDAEIARETSNPPRRREVAGAKEPGHREAMNTERRDRAELGEPPFGQRVRRRAVHGDADLMPALRQTPRQVPHMPEEPTDRSS